MYQYYTICPRPRQSKTETEQTSTKNIQRLVIGAAQRDLTPRSQI